MRMWTCVDVDMSTTCQSLYHVAWKCSCKSVHVHSPSPFCLINNTVFALFFFFFFGHLQTKHDYIKVKAWNIRPEGCERNICWKWSSLRWFRKENVSSRPNRIRVHPHTCCCCWWWTEVSFRYYSPWLHLLFSESCCSTAWLTLLSIYIHPIITERTLDF